MPEDELPGILEKLTEALCQNGILFLSFQEGDFEGQRSGRYFCEYTREELERGVTALDARGMYSGNRKDVLFCVVSRKESAQLKELVVGHDAQAFVIVSDAREVLGEGFIEYRQ